METLLNYYIIKYEVGETQYLTRSGEEGDGWTMEPVGKSLWFKYTTLLYYPTIRYTGDGKDWAVDSQIRTTRNEVGSRDGCKETVRQGLKP